MVSTRTIAQTNASKANTERGSLSQAHPTPTPPDDASMTCPHTDRLAGPYRRCRKPTGNFSTDSVNIGSDTPIPVVTLTSNSPAGNARAAITHVIIECA